MKKVLISTLATGAFLMMMAAGGTGDKNFIAGCIMAAISLGMLLGMIILCRVWKEDLKAEVDDED